MPLFSSTAFNVTSLIRRLPGALKGGSCGKVLAKPPIVLNRLLNAATGTRFPLKNPAALAGIVQDSGRVAAQLHQMGNLGVQSTPVLIRFSAFSETANLPDRQELHGSVPTIEHDHASKRGCPPIKATAPPRVSELHPIRLFQVVQREAQVAAETMRAFEPSTLCDARPLEAINPAIFAADVVGNIRVSDDSPAWEGDVDSDFESEFESEFEDDFGARTATRMDPVPSAQTSDTDETAEQRFEREGREVLAAAEAWERSDRLLAVKPSVPPKSEKVAQYLAQKAAKALFVQPIVVEETPAQPSTTLDLLNVITRRIEQMEQQWGTDAFDSGLEASDSDSDWDASDA